MKKNSARSPTRTTSSSSSTKCSAAWASRADVGLGAPRVKPDIFCFGKKARSAASAPVEGRTRWRTTASDLEPGSTRPGRHRPWTWSVRRATWRSTATTTSWTRVEHGRSGPLQRPEGTGGRVPHLLCNVRGRDSCALRLRNAADRDKVLKALWAKRMLILPCGGSSIRYRPALNVPRRGSGSGIEITAAC